MPPSRFRTLDEYALAELSDDDVIAYVRAARAAGHPAAATLAIQLLAYRHERRVRWRVSLKVPERFVEQVAHDALVRAIGARFDRASPGEFFSWLDTIVSREIADFYRSPAAKMATRETQLPDEPDSGGEDFPHERVEAADAVGRALAMLDNAMHREVIELYLFQDLPARAIAERLSTTENNVHQVAKRFRDLLRGLLAEDAP